MKAFVTGIGEETTRLCMWSLERLGFDVSLIDTSDSLWAKLKLISDIATEDYLRVDADVVVNKNVLELIKQKNWWVQATMYEWYKQDIGHGGVQLIKKECLPAIRLHIEEAKELERPETYLSRLPEFHNPRRFETFDKVCGIHGFKQSDTERVMETKRRRGHYKDYDWELAERLNEL